MLTGVFFTQPKNVLTTKESCGHSRDLFSIFLRIFSYWFWPFFPRCDLCWYYIFGTLDLFESFPLLGFPLPARCNIYSVDKWRTWMRHLICKKYKPCHLWEITVYCVRIKYISSKEVFTFFSQLFVWFSQFTVNSGLNWIIKIQNNWFIIQLILVYCFVLSLTLKDLFWYCTL